MTVDDDQLARGQRLAAIVLLVPGVLLFGFVALFPDGPATFTERLGMLIMPTVIIVVSAVCLWRARNRPEVWPSGFAAAGMVFGLIVGMLVTVRNDLFGSPATGIVIIAIAATVGVLLFFFGGRAAKRVATGPNQHVDAD